MGLKYVDEVAAVEENFLMASEQTNDTFTYVNCTAECVYNDALATKMVVLTPPLCYNVFALIWNTLSLSLSGPVYLELKTTINILLPQRLIAVKTSEKKVMNRLYNYASAMIASIIISVLLQSSDLCFKFDRALH